ncbi:hypothetical protein QQ008_04860 [Fulvivirgaceae bacterium BMA10]|uniref:Uncharacterized protein n=1 Tax=Splendidivirga corallicola TaxID=3051826 RepID=A0ABT8KJ04_9BACT|nr:hypothetical protein [Fulvivirgaceae bacterium BMA10]
MMNIIAVHLSFSGVYGECEIEFLRSKKTGVSTFSLKYDYWVFVLQEEK